MPRLANAEDLMPYFERTGMLSHRHPFYGVGFFAAEDQGPPRDNGDGTITWPDGTIEIIPGGPADTTVQKPPAVPGPTPGNEFGPASERINTGAGAGASNMLLLGGAALLVFLVLKRK